MWPPTSSKRRPQAMPAPEEGVSLPRNSEGTKGLQPPVRRHGILPYSLSVVTPVTGAVSGKVESQSMPTDSRVSHAELDRMIAVSRKSVSVRVDLGERRVITKN